ncbi:RPM1-interacting protein 4-like isoform X3 [Mangifera indica]|uniref:RPM1-interacting protein 4-like isoform X3 n=1 Tax=Mangifera indica TaxID=29780 RepID=UPI001CFA4D98|nr:RPM1-interacting protein 4-like isoform X3 [Mangifera indica]
MSLKEQQKHPHVPKFGNWEKDNIPYTTYFENARKEKAAVRMNPNDPEENPQAFMYGRGDLVGHGDFRPVQTPVYVESDKYISVEKQGIESHAVHNPQGRQKSIKSEFGSNKSHSDYSHLQLGHRPLKSDRSKRPGEGSNSFSTSVQGDPRQKSGSYSSDETRHHRTVSVPKFGAWDETDPKSGEGFTIIFNEVKKEKQIASTKFPTVHSKASSHSDGQRCTSTSSPSKSKGCCGLFSRK